MAPHATKVTSTHAGRETAGRRIRDQVRPAGGIGAVPRPRGGVEALGRPPAGRPPAAVLVAICLWAAGLVLVGLAVAVAAAVVLRRQPPGWYPPVVVGTGCAGIALTVAALAAVDARRLWWVLVSAATAALMAVIGVTVAAS